MNSIVKNGQAKKAKKAKIVGCICGAQCMDKQTQQTNPLDSAAFLVDLIDSETHRLGNNAFMI